MMNRMEFENKVWEYRDKNMWYFVVGLEGGEIYASEYSFNLDGDRVDLWYKSGNRREWHVGNVKLDYIKYIYPLVSEEIERELKMWDFD